RRIYAERRHVLAEAMRRELGDAAAFKVPGGGMAVWVRFTPPVDTELWAQRSLERGLWWHTGKRYAFDQRPIPFARFSVARLNERGRPEAVKRLAAARS